MCMSECADAKFDFVCSSGNGKLATWGSVLGFLVMMTLDVGLG